MGVSKMENERDIENEKKKMQFFVLGSWMSVLFAVTVILYMVALYFAKYQPELEIYLYVIAAASIGAFWGIGMNETAQFWNWSKYGMDFYNKFDWSKEGNAKEWYSPESFDKNLRIWKNRFFKSFIAFIIISFFILPIFNSII